MLVDSHCHLDFPDFDTELNEVIARAKSAGVGLMVTISTRIRQFDRIRTIAENYENIFCTIGTHPHNAGEETGISAQEIINLSKHSKVIGIGESGLDYHYDKAPRDKQATGFRIHIEAARETGLPLVIHARQADDDIIRILENEMGKGPFPFLLHCFSSSMQLAQVGVALGGYVSFSGILTFKNSQDIRDIAASVPLDRLLLETDAPYLAPMPHRGKRNEPAYVANTASVLADIMGVSQDKIAEITTDNFFRLFTKVPTELNRSLS